MLPLVLYRVTLDLYAAKLTIAMRQAYQDKWKYGRCISAIRWVTWRAFTWFQGVAIQRIISSQKSQETLHAWKRCLNLWYHRLELWFEKCFQEYKKYKKKKFNSEEYKKENDRIKSTLHKRMQT